MTPPRLPGEHAAPPQWRESLDWRAVADFLAVVSAPGLREIVAAPPSQWTDRDIIHAGQRSLWGHASGSALVSGYGGHLYAKSAAWVTADMLRLDPDNKPDSPYRRLVREWGLGVTVQRVRVAARRRMAP